MRALLIIDMQNDFMPSGPLPVAQADTLAFVINDLMSFFSLVIATKDYHPQDHVSFATNHSQKVGESIQVVNQAQRLWPVHCVQGTPGAELVSTLNINSIDRIFHKGQMPHLDSYSAFFDNAHLNSTGLGEFLKEKGVKEIYLAGVALDYCVLASALDALDLGFDVYLINDACAGVNAQEGDCAIALEIIQEKGGNIIVSSQIRTIFSFS